MKKSQVFPVFLLGLFLLAVGCNNSGTTKTTSPDTAKSMTDTTRTRDSVSSNPDAMSEPH